MSAIYLRHGDEFVAMTEAPYEAEDVLQALLAEHPEILAGGDSSATGWVLVRREAGVADTEGVGSRWSLDHLFLDVGGVPTLVEVKRSTDTRARREVVAQMLDYAANAGTWTVEQLQSWFEDECQRRGSDAAATLESTFGFTDPDRYWELVKTNLAADRIRLVFVADEIASELRSIIEFLNRQMSETEVLAIEVKQYLEAGGARQTIVPKVIGQTEAARAAKGAPRTRAAAFDFSLAPASYHELVQRMDSLVEDLGVTVKAVNAGRNYEPAELEPGVSYRSGIVVRASGGGVSINLELFRKLGADAAADDLLERLRAVSGVPVTARSWPSVPCESLLGDWSRTRAEFIEPYFHARHELLNLARSAASGPNSV